MAATKYAFDCSHLLHKLRARGSGSGRAAFSGKAVFSGMAADSFRFLEFSFFHCVDLMFVACIVRVQITVSRLAQEQWGFQPPAGTVDQNQP